MRVCVTANRDHYNNAGRLGAGHSCWRFHFLDRCFEKVGNFPKLQIALSTCVGSHSRCLLGDDHSVQGNLIAAFKAFPILLLLQHVQFSESPNHRLRHDDFNGPLRRKSTFSLRKHSHWRRYHSHDVVAWSECRPLGTYNFATVLEGLLPLSCVWVLQETVARRAAISRDGAPQSQQAHQHDPCGLVATSD